MKLINKIHLMDGPRLTAHDRHMIRSLALQSTPGTGAVVETASGKVARWTDDGCIVVSPRPLTPGRGMRTPRKSKTGIVEFIEVA